MRDTRDYADEPGDIALKTFESLIKPLPDHIKKRVTFITPTSHAGNWVYDRFMSHGGKK